MHPGGDFAFCGGYYIYTESAGLDFTAEEAITTQALPIGLYPAPISTSDQPLITGQELTRAFLEIRLESTFIGRPDLGVYQFYASTEPLSMDHGYRSHFSNVLSDNLDRAREFRPPNRFDDGISRG